MTPLNEANRRTYRTVYHALSHLGFSAERRIIEGQKLAREYPHYEDAITEAYLDSVLDYLPPEVDVQLKKMSVSDVLMMIRNWKNR